MGWATEYLQMKSAAYPEEGGEKRRSWWPAIGAGAVGLGAGALGVIGLNHAGYEIGAPDDLGHMVSQHVDPAIKQVMGDDGYHEMISRVQKELGATHGALRLTGDALQTVHDYAAQHGHPFPNR